MNPFDKKITEEPLLFDPNQQHNGRSKISLGEGYTSKLFVEKQKSNYHLVVFSASKAKLLDCIPCSGALHFLFLQEAKIMTIII